MTFAQRIALWESCIANLFKEIPSDIQKYGNEVYAISNTVINALESGVAVDIETIITNAGVNWAPEVVTAVIAALQELEQVIKFLQSQFPMPADVIASVKQGYQDEMGAKLLATVDGNIDTSEKYKTYWQAIVAKNAPAVVAHKLGKLPARKDDRDLLFSKYITVSKRPAQFGHENLLTTRHMYGNGPDDSVVKGFMGAGNCVFAAICNAITLFNASAGKVVLFTGKEAIAAYSEVTGYKIGDDSTDRGTDMRVALSWLKNTGIADVNGTRHKIGGYVALEVGNLDHFEQALYLGLVTLIGVDLPQSAESQFNSNKPWTVIRSQSAGGHCIMGDALRNDFLFETWARDQQVVPAFVTKYMDEGYVLFSEEEILNGKDIDGLDFATLQRDLTAL